MRMECIFDWREISRTETLRACVRPLDVRLLMIYHLLRVI